MENIKTLDQALRQSNIYFLIVLPFLKKRKRKRKINIYIDALVSIYKRERSSIVIIDNNRHSYCPWNNFQQP